MRISDWSSDVCSSDLIEDRRYEDQSDSDMPFVDPIAEKKDRRAERHTDRGRGQHMAPVDAAETVGQIAAKPGADDPRDANGDAEHQRSEEHTSELQSLMRISYAVFCLKKKTTNRKQEHSNNN